MEHDEKTVSLKDSTPRKPMSEKVTLTGVTGQDGSYLSELLYKGYEVHGEALTNKSAKSWKEFNQSSHGPRALPSH